MHDTMYHIKTKDTYYRTKRSNDPEINDLIIIYKDSDALPSGEDSPEHHACGIDQLPIIHQTSVVKRSEGCPASRKSKP